MIEKLNCIDAVIGLPANIFYGTSIPTCVLVLRKCRKQRQHSVYRRQQ
jgi:type I restriction enzyme M protein